MISPLSVKGFRSRRTNFLSVGVTLCAIIAAICVAPLAFVQPWIAIWLLILLTVLVLGTFGIWAFHAVRNPRLLDTEDHVEHMAAISLLGANQEGGRAYVEAITADLVVENPSLPEGKQA